MPKRQLGNEESEIEDTEGHKKRLEETETEAKDDTQGKKRNLGETEEDVEGHAKRH